MDRLRAMFSSHPNPASDAGDVAFALVIAAAECGYVCTTCADACLEERDPAALRKCIRLSLDCAEICALTARLISRPGEQDRAVLRAQLEACAKACRACADECDRHDHEHCRICAETCRACADACHAMIEKLVA
ncbi:MAG TPA: four-helix bundle copper-binding protein [Thermoanaerobaculia bacterium]|nr:four-helix bundle copper-binding protein [Thermoanaerobaculia bacterium]